MNPTHDAYDYRKEDLGDFLILQKLGVLSGRLDHIHDHVREIEKSAHRIEALLKPSAAPRTFIVGPVSTRPASPQHERPFMTLILDNTQQSVLRIPPIVNALGEPAEVEPGSLQWNGSDDSKLELLVADDQMSAIARTRGPAGSVDVVAQADADLGEGVKPIYWKMTVVINQATAVGGELLADEPTIRPGAGSVVISPGD